MIKSKLLVLGGVTICKYAVVSANTFVNKDVPLYYIVGGNPISVLKKY
jgi:acetyltransferase-like isoleucine patch superfamily enzyme